MKKRGTYIFSNLETISENGGRKFGSSFQQSDINCEKEEGIVVVAGINGRILCCPTAITIWKVGIPWYGSCKELIG